MLRVTEVLQNVVRANGDVLDPAVHDALLGVIDNLDTDLESFGFEPSDDLDEATNKLELASNEAILEDDEEASEELATEDDEDEEVELEEEEEEEEDDDGFDFNEE